MRTNFRSAGGILILVLILLAIACDEKATEPEESFDVTNGNQYCGLVAGYIKSSEGNGLSGARVSIYPLPAARLEQPAGVTSMSRFFNYPNPFSNDTYFIYYLSGSGEHAITIRIYDLHHNLLRQLDGVPGQPGDQLYHFDGLDNQQETLPGGLMPCEVIAQHAEGTDSMRIALAKGINISDHGGLESYSVTTASDGKYIINDIPLNIQLLQTTTFAPQQELSPDNWPYVEIARNLNDRFIVSAEKSGYSVVSDTVTLTPGGVTRSDMTLR